MLTMTKYEVEQLLQYATRECASFLKIDNVEWKGACELLEEIRQINAELYTKLTAFIDAYREWFAYSETLIAKGGAQNDDERSVVLKKCSERDSKRSELLVTLGKK